MVIYGILFGGIHPAYFAPSRANMYMKRINHSKNDKPQNTNLHGRL